MKISLEEVQESLKRAGIAAEQAGVVLKDLQEVIQELEAEKVATKLPTKKNEFGVIIYDKDGVLTGKDFVATVYTIPQGDDHGLVLGKISSAARDQNEAAKRKKNILKTLGEACESLKRKFIKAKNVNLKTKEPVRVLVTNNALV